MEVQKGSATGPRSHSQEVAILGLEPDGTGTGLVLPVTELREGPKRQHRPGWTGARNNLSLSETCTESRGQVVTK